MASQSFTAPDGRRVLFGWVTAPHGADFAGGQTIPRIITASPGGPLRFLPLPELTSLHLNRKSFGATATGSLARNTSNSYHLNATFHLTALANHSFVPATAAALSLQLFVNVTGGAVGMVGPTLLPPWSARAQAALAGSTSLTGKILDSRSNLVDPTACAQACASHRPHGSCGGWTFRQENSSCTLRGAGARVLADVGSGCDALGHAGCTSGLMGWQLRVPGVPTPISVMPTPQHMLTLELFVDQQVCEVFVHDGRGQGSAVATFACQPQHEEATGVGVGVVGVDGVRVSGALSDMAGCILPPPPEGAA